MPNDSGRSPLPVGSPAPAITATALDGTVVRVDADGTRLLFVTSQCKECRVAWERMVAPGEAVTLIVTPGPETDSRRRVGELGRSSGITPERILMASDVWHAFGIQKAPWLVEIRGGTVSQSAEFG